MTDLELIKKMVEPIAAKAGMFRGRVMGMITEEAIRDVYKHVGVQGIKDAAAAIIRIGESKEEPVSDNH